MKYSPKAFLRDLDYKKLFYRVLFLAAIFLVISGYIAYTRLYLTPERRFWMAMNTNLSVPSVIRSTETGGTGNKSTEVTRYTFGGQAAQAKVSSVGFKSATAESNVTTETITTPATQYVRYVNIFSTEKKEDGSNYNFDAVKGIWAKDADPADAAAADEKRLAYLQPLITLAPFGNLTPTARQSILAELKSSGAYDIDYRGVTYQNTEQDKFMTYSVRVFTKKYVAILQKYFTAAGLGEFPPLDPSGYAENARVNAQFVLNRRTNTISAISFNGQTEVYSNYGVTKQIALPADAISLEDLQGRLQNTQ